MLRRHFFILLLASSHMSLLPIHAQDNSDRQIYQQAESNYKIGRIDLAREQLLSNLGAMRAMKESAYRLLALCYLGQDNVEEAERYSAMLLNEFPYYTVSPQDPQRFADMIANIKAGLSATITTASNQAENLSEVPVPATLITEEMIRNSGARNLQEVLAAFVPGMYIIDCNDDVNIAMRGIYSNSQEKILIMINGHRVNSYATNIAAPDFSMSLEKLKQIEVLRGPASSLYGGVALTAVVNLITKQGIDVDGITAKVGAGNYGQRQGNLQLGKHYFDLDLFTWGSIYTASGETCQVPPGQDTDTYAPNEVTVGGVGNKPSYDFGVQFNWRDVQFFYNTHFSQIVAPLTISTMAKPYFHDKYTTFNGISPSYSTQSHHADLSYRRQIGKLALKGTLTYDNSDLSHYQVLSESPVPEFSYIIPVSNEKLSTIFSQGGLARYINGQEQTYGGQLKGDFSYINNATHKGSLSFGAEYTHYQLDDVRYVLSYNHTNTLPEMEEMKNIGKGHEDFYNTFIQLKHHWGSFIFNTGLRYDHKVRNGESNINEVSPRLALIFLQPKWNLKFSYSRAFVDAPYLYRKTNSFFDLLQNVADSPLDSESLNSFQLTFAGQEWLRGLNFEVNAFYNQAQNMIMTHVISYVNEGNNKTAGVEFMANYRHKCFTANFNLAWLKTFKLRFLETDIDMNNNTPTFMSHLVLGWQPVNNLRLHSHISFTDKQKTFNTDVSSVMTYLSYLERAEQIQKNSEDLKDLVVIMSKALQEMLYEESIESRTLLDFGADYTLGPVTVGLDIHNLFNSHTYLSGMNTKLVPQKGRWWMVSLGYKF